MAETPATDCLVLVVDDEEVVRNVTELLLEGAGFGVVTAASGQEAVDLLTSRDVDVDVALLDAMLPDRDGREVAEDLRRLRPDLPIVMASGYDEQMIAQQLGEIPDVRFIRKPYGAAELVAALTDAIDA